MTVRVLTLWLGLAPALVLLPTELQAQGPGLPPFMRAVPEVGIRGGWDWDAGATTVGGQVRIPVGVGGGAVAPSGDYLLAGDGPQWQVNLDLLMPAGPAGMLYVGTGGALVRRQFENAGFPDPTGRHTKLGINMVLGVGVPRFLRLPVDPYAEVRITTVSRRDASQLVSVGVNVPLGTRASRR